MSSRLLLPFAVVIAVLLLSACSGSSTLGGGTATPVNTATPDPLTTWLKPERQQLLLSTLQQLAPDNGWVAGCVYETKADQAILAALKKPAGRAFFSEFTNPALGAALVVRVEGSTAPGDFIGGAPTPTTYCYIPK
ncbi:MAG: hypothetical protein ABI577_14890 [bacterium]